jgi:hypothetical protein
MTVCCLFKSSQVLSKSACENDLRGAESQSGGVCFLGSVGQNYAPNISYHDSSMHTIHILMHVHDKDKDSSPI